MESGWWNCGEIDHHYKSCPKEVTKGYRKTVRIESKKMNPVVNQGTWKKKLEHKWLDKVDNKYRQVFHKFLQFSAFQAAEENEADEFDIFQDFKSRGLQQIPESTNNEIETMLMMTSESSSSLPCSNKVNLAPAAAAKKLPDCPSDFSCGTAKF
ncbi:unnamed protein product [Allacma fusca]|uniref:Uncharacterized protein n=1 Tax=Allacma fusca TaxID=39272 RepID=A0A8J2NTI4_9HEXA|nr:unnamed protein product [Allacma fusca]